MYYFRVVCAVVISLILLGLGTKLYAKIINFEQVAANVPYAKVAQLLSTNWDKKIVYGDHRDQYVLHWRAVSQKQTTESTPSNHRIIFIHGGCWLEQFTIAHSYPLTTALAQQGFDVFSVEYRRSGNGGEWPVALHDIESAIGAINDEQASQQSPLEKISNILIGHSAGGHLASLAAHRLSKNAENIHFVGLAPIMDLPSYAEGENSCQTATPSFMNGTPIEKAQDYKHANPLSYKFENIASAAVFAGGQDKLVPVAMTKHPQIKQILANDAGHFDWIHPGTSAFQDLIEHLKDIGKNE